MCDVIEVEYERERLFKDIVRFSTKVLQQYMRAYEVSGLLLRFVFNRVMALSEEKKEEKENKEDAVFIMAEGVSIKQMQLDLMNHYVPLTLIEKYTEELVQWWNEAATQIQQETQGKQEQQEEKKVEVDARTGQLLYGRERYEDLANLGKDYPQHVASAIALQIRYRYLGLLHQGRARNFAGMGYSREDKTVLEAFATAFNHFFPNYCSAFPDLEACFGSQGSFFALPLPAWTRFKTIYINPSLDENIINNAIHRTLAHVDNMKRKTPTENEAAENTPRQIIHLTLPNWDKMLSFDLLAKSSSAYTIVPKNKLEFIDYMQTPPKLVLSSNPILLVQLNIP